MRQDKQDDPRVETYMARCYAWLDRPEDARKTLDGVLTRHADYGPALLERGRALVQAGRPADAEEWLRRAVAAMPHDYQANFALGDALEKEGKADEAKPQRKRRPHEGTRRPLHGTYHAADERAAARPGPAL